MTANPPDSSNERVNSLELCAALEQTLTAYYGEPVKIANLARRPWEYRSSFALESLRVSLGSRGELAIMFKDLSWNALTPEARQAKRYASYNPLREIAVYEQALRSRPGYSPPYYGAVVQPERDRYWLFIEQVKGVELYQIGDFDVWKHVARWLAEMHTNLQAAVQLQAELRARLVMHDAAAQELWFERACQSVERRCGAGAGRRLREMSKLLPRLNRALSARRPTLIHGEFYPANVLVEPVADSWRVCAIDWEMAGAGSGLLDLAALVVGRWSEEQQVALASSYYEAVRLTGEEWLTEEFFQTLDCCRWYIALRWLGWSEEWSAPPDHAHDWREEAMSAGQRLIERPIRYR